MRTKTPITCLVSLHGIGFEQPPLPDIPGYADNLHKMLSNHLDTSLLSDDPQRLRSKPGENGPIYVQSCWPPGSNNSEMGLARLGTWAGQDFRSLDITHAPLICDQSSIAHIALVYSNLEGQGPKPGLALLSASMILFSLSRYAHPGDVIRMLLRDIQVALTHQISLEPEATPGLQVRRDPGFQPQKAPLKRSTTNRLLVVLRQLENDVAAYVLCDELRERVRCFVIDALLRLACRDDVAGIVINAHSNGSVIAYDALRHLPPFVVAKVKAFITAGSPLRKYVDLFRWGREIENLHTIQSWINYWDARDPVADPLSPPPHWRRDTPIPVSQQTLIHSTNPCTGQRTNIAVTDVQVDNLCYSYGGGLQTHNYWNNDVQFVQPLAQLLQRMIVDNGQLVAG